MRTFQSGDETPRPVCIRQGESTSGASGGAEAISSIFRLHADERRGIDGRAFERRDGRHLSSWSRGGAVHWLTTPDRIETAAPVGGATSKMLASSTSRTRQGE